jgi:hypothetical protein
MFEIYNSCNIDTKAERKKEKYAKEREKKRTKNYLHTFDYTHQQKKNTKKIYFKIKRTNISAAYKYLTVTA